MSDDEMAFRAQEEELPARAGEMFAAARARMLAAGHSVVESHNGYLYRVFPDGREIVLRQFDPSRAVEAGKNCSSDE